MGRLVGIWMLLVFTFNYFLKRIIPRRKLFLNSHQNLPHDEKKLEYSVIRGNVGQSFDVVVALKQKGSTLPSSEPRWPWQRVERGVIKEPTPIGSGPWGGEGGKPWDDGVFTGIKQIFVTRGNDAIALIQVEYDRNGQSVWSIKHGGGNNGVATHRIKLEYPNEILTCISGYYGPLNNSDKANVVKSLSFYTSRGKYGPYGEESGTFFTSTTTQGKILGLHGRSSSDLDAIGVHTQHWLGNNKPFYNKSCFKLF